MRPPLGPLSATLRLWRRGLKDLDHVAASGAFGGLCGSAHALYTRKDPVAAKDAVVMVSSAVAFGASAATGLYLTLPAVAPLTICASIGTLALLDVIDN